MPERLVVIGDLNGDDHALHTILCGMGITDHDGVWIARDTHVVQVGDVVNRGATARVALDRIMRLSRQARRRASRFTMLLGNHEAMVTLGNLAWCHPEEFLEFAGREERARFDAARAAHVYALLDARTRGGETDPVVGALRDWEEKNVPGRDAYRNAFGPDGPYGRFLRSLPVAIRVGSVLITHGGLHPRFAALGLPRLHRMVQDHWSTHPETSLDLPVDSPLVSEEGPLWCRTFAIANDEITDGLLERTLRAVRASSMCVGHTRTDLIGGEKGMPYLRRNGRLCFTDVGLGGSGGTVGAYYVERGQMFAWRPDRARVRLGPLPARMG